MTITVQPVDPAEREILKRELQGIYTDGECYALALALSRGLDWPLYGLRRGSKRVVAHAFVQGPDGWFWDGRGRVTVIDIHDRFGDGEIEPIEEHDLYAWRPINDRSIARARFVAESAWTQLKWRKPLATPYLTFADELLDLLRKHGLGLASPLPTTRPFLYRMDEEEQKNFNLTLVPNIVSGEYFIDRTYEK